MVAMAIAGCGGASESGKGGAATHSREQAATAGVKEAVAFAILTRGESESGFNIDAPERRPPKRLLIRDIEMGSGRVAHRGDDVSVYYVGDYYRTGKYGVRTWPPARPLKLRLGFEEWGDTWEEGIEGMRVGGLREMVVPEAFRAGGPAFDYVVRLVSADTHDAREAGV